MLKPLFPAEVTLPTLALHGSRRVACVVGVNCFEVWETSTPSRPVLDAGC